MPHSGVHREASAIACGMHSAPTVAGDRRHGGKSTCSGEERAPRIERANWRSWTPIGRNLARQRKIPFRSRINCGIVSEAHDILISLAANRRNRRLRCMVRVTERARVGGGVLDPGSWLGRYSNDPNSRRWRGSRNACTGRVSFHGSGQAVALLADDDLGDALARPGLQYSSR